MSPYIVGPFVKELRPLEPWLEPRSGKDDVYEQLGHSGQAKKGPVRVILIDHVPGIGLRGDVVEVKRMNAFLNLVPAQKAVYASEKNLRLYRELIESQATGGPSSALSALTADRLGRTRFLVRMSADADWTLERWHLRANLLQQGLVLPLDAIELPATPLRGPSLQHEGADFFAAVTINGNPVERIQVHCVLHHIGQELPEDWDRLHAQRVCILDEQRPLLDERLAAK